MERNKQFTLKLLATWIMIIAALSLSGCMAPKKSAATTKRYKLDNDVGPHPTEKIPNISKIPDAVPKAEPKSKYGNPKTYTVFKKSYTVMNSSKGYVARGKASWYGKKFHGFRTSSGEPYDMYAMSAAHKTLPLPTYATVTNLDNGKSIVVKINDRGPFHEDRIIDLSYAAATKLGILHKGTGNVEIRAIDPVLHLPTKNGVQRAVPGNNRYLQIGAYKQEGNAKQMVSKLQKLTKEHPISIRLSPKSKNTLYHVHIGPIPDEATLARLKNKLVANNIPNPIPVKLD